MISLLPIEVLDLFFRFSTVGILLFLASYLYIANQTEIKWPSMALIICISAYVLLTTPIPNHDYGWLRQPLLLATDLTSFAILWFSQAVLAPKSLGSKLAKLIYLPIVMWCLFLAGFFLFTPGRGVIHDLSHLVGLVVLIIVLIRATLGYWDDLVDRRRNMRLILITGCCAYMTVLTLFEFVFLDVKDTAVFSIGNAALILALSFYVAAKVVLNNKNRVEAINKPNDNAKACSGTIRQSNVEQGERSTTQQRELDKLKTLMEQGLFKEQELTVKRLSQKMALPEHQLRVLINQELGFTNFSHYLNSYRIPSVCEQLKQVDQKQIPILTIALDTGYGSIASFNRAFKQQMGMTPTQYRDQF